jgi:ferritin
MQMKQELAQQFNHQINEELNSWYVYRALAAWYSHQGLHGFAHWFVAQADEELEHADKLRDYMEKRGNLVVYQDIKAKNIAIKEAIDGIKQALAHEQHISQSIRVLTEASIQAKDHGAEIFLHWFETEQEEEEEQVQMILDKFALLSNSMEGLYLLDKDLQNAR